MSAASGRFSALRSVWLHYNSRAALSLRRGGLLMYPTRKHTLPLDQCNQFASNTTARDRLVRDCRFLPVRSVISTSDSRLNLPDLRLLPVLHIRSSRVLLWLGDWGNLSLFWNGDDTVVCCHISKFLKISYSVHASTKKARASAVSHLCCRAYLHAVMARQ